MKFDLFVIPFTAGLIFLLCYLVGLYAWWFYKLEKSEKRKVLKGFFSFKLFPAVKEIIMESLLHKRIFGKNMLLGFMHMSLAFGWFLLILVGNIEDRIYDPETLNPPYVPIFFRYFNANAGNFPLHRFFSFAMDLLLLLVLTGVLLALGKRLFNRAYGMRKTTKLKTGDRFALMSLWLIFPLRLLAESFTTAIYGGGAFLTAATGNFLGSSLPASELAYPAWWAYSISLGVFFTALPFSRYMHIPTEVVLILSRHFGLKENGHRTPFTQIEINACSRCGICLDACQLSFAGGIQNVQSAYQLKAIRYNNIKPGEALNCLMCGRCQQVCPVGIDILSIRQIVRNEMNGRAPDISFVKQKMPEQGKADIIYFAGCMSHQTPGIKAAMKKIFENTGVNYWFMDEEGGICCGRPMMLAGHTRQARILIDKNKELMEKSGAHTLVTSCPICYKTFVQDYNLNIKVLHHTEYINELISNNIIKPNKLDKTVVYHDPCELSREIRIYDEPRRVLSKAARLVPAGYEKDDTLCCGGSLANLSATAKQRSDIAEQAYRQINRANADMMITSCPMCKKVFERVSDVPVKDIAEITVESLKERIVNTLSVKEKQLTHEVH